MARLSETSADASFEWRSHSILLPWVGFVVGRGGFDLSGVHIVWYCSVHDLGTGDLTSTVDDNTAARLRGTWCFVTVHAMLAWSLRQHSVWLTC